MSSYFPDVIIFPNFTLTGREILILWGVTFCCFPQDITRHYNSIGAALPFSSSGMRVIYHNWSATKQRPHLQSVAEISRYSVLSGDRIRQCETSSGSRHKDTDQFL